MAWGVTVASDASSPGNYKITASPTTDGTELPNPHPLILRIKLPSQPNHPGIDVPFNVVVNYATCDCSQLLWQLPAAKNTKTVNLTSPVSTGT